MISLSQRTSKTWAGIQRGCGTTYAMGGMGTKWVATCVRVQGSWVKRREGDFGGE